MALGLFEIIFQQVANLGRLKLLEGDRAWPIISMCFLRTVLKSMPSDPSCFSNSHKWFLGIQSPKPSKAFQ